MSVQYLVKNKKDCNRPVCVEVFWVVQILPLLILQYLQCKYCAIKRNLLRNLSFSLFEMKCYESCRDDNKDRMDVRLDGILCAG